MARLRIKIVTGPRAGWWRPRSAQQVFVVASLVVHLLGAAALIWIPELRRGPRIPPDATIVELVGALPSSRPAASAPAPVRQPAKPPAPKPPEEGVTLQQPEPVPEEKPEKKPEPPSPEEVSPAPPAGPQTDPDDTAVATSETAGSAAAGGSISALEIGDAAFAWYRAAVTNALYNNWRRPIVSGLREPVEVRVAFEIMSDGNVRSVRVEHSSGIPSLDRSALRAAGNAAPLPALPSSIGEPYLPASFVFRLYPEGY